MKKIFLVISSVCCLSILSNAQNLQWAYSFGGSQQNIRALGVTTDAAGNLYTVGYFDGEMDFDPGPDSNILGPTRYGNSFLMKMSPSGNHISTTPIGTGRSGRNHGGVVKFDPSGNLIIAGFFTGDDVDFDPDDTTEYKLSAIGSDNNAYLLKLDAAGKFVWAKRWAYNININRRNTEEGPVMTLDPQGNIFCAGHFAGKVDFDPNDTTSFMMEGFQGDGYVTKLDANGNFLWAKQIVGDTVFNKYVTVKGISLDGAGNIYVCGDFNGKTDFNPDTTAKFEMDAASKHGFILKLDASGNFVWAKKIGKDNAHPVLNYNSASDIQADASGNVYVTGGYMETVNFGSISATSNGISDIYIAKLDASGNYVWVKTAGTFYGDEYGYRLTLDNAGNILASGNFRATTSFEGSSVTTNGSADMFVVKITPSGNVLWAKGMGGPGNYERIQSITTHGDNIYTCGRMIGTVNFDPNGTYNVTAGTANSYYCNFFVHKMSSSPTFLQDIFKDEGMFIYPNPATNEINIQVESKKDGVVSIIDLQGRILHQQVVKGNNAMMNIENLPSGSYILQYKNAQKVTTAKFQKQ